MPACADAQLPSSIASNTPRQSLGTAIVITGGDGGGIWPMALIGFAIGGGPEFGTATEAAGELFVTAIPGWLACGVVVVGVAVARGARGSPACAKAGAAITNVPNAINPTFKTH